ncbi:MAG TPA: exodeoxyribonuclease VII large subunit [Candidatus Deferrimicrobiaceae bacterium]|nr:exodeoxyribonuclease VII large subunit [Candidatus Deferrimicrobiaceae bacterium]
MSGDSSGPLFPPPAGPAGKEFSRGVVTVSELTASIKECLEDSFRFVRVEGEVSNHKVYPSGHRYFSLKDEGAQIRVVLFRGRERFVFGEIRDGQMAVVTGSVGVYERKGEYQLYAQSVEVRGLGSLLLELEKRKARLSAEGLFDPARKRPLPRFPARIGIVTSREGAALRDMIRVARRRWPAIGITLAPSMVQGEGAAGDIAQALAALASQGGVDLIIVGRGGGSVEDLWAFNEEAVVRAIASSPVPTISAVGHETDFTLADLAADHRAPTPTAAATVAVPDRAEFLERVATLSLRVRRAEQYVRETHRREWRIAALALADPRPLLQARRYEVVERTDALLESLRERTRGWREAVSARSGSVRVHSPTAWVSRKRGDLAVLAERAARQADAKRTAFRRALEILEGKLSALDPRSVLTRGYAIATHRGTGRAVRSASEVVPGDAVDIQVADGAFGAVVEGGSG